MGLLGAIVLATVAIILLSTLRTWLYFEFVALSLLIFKTNRVGKWLYTLIFLPGTILHELSHWLMAELLGVRTGEITILPDFETTEERGSERLGSVATASSGPLRSFMIGAAPFFTGLFILWILGSLLQRGDWQLWQYILMFYGIIVVGSSMLLSKEDRRSWPFIAILVSSLLILYYFLPLTIPVRLIVAATNIVSRLNQVLFVTVGLILGIIGISYTLRRIIQKLLGKKVIRR
ncbi:MAG: hypothetical protein Fur0011_6370 [Candidatus Microgenomates bacterium]